MLPEYTRNNVQTRLSFQTLHQDICSPTIRAGWYLWWQPHPIPPPTPIRLLHFMVNRSIVCPINDFVVFTHISQYHCFWNTPVYFSSGHMTSYWHRWNVASMSVWHRHNFMCLLGTYSLSPDVCGGGLKKWPLSVRVSIRPSVRHSVLPSIQFFPATPLKSFIWLIWNFIDCLLIMMKMLIFVSATFDQVMALADSYLVSATPSHIFYRIHLKLCWMFHHDVKICQWFWIFSFIALCHFWHFSNFRTVWPRKLNFGELLVFDIKIILIMVGIC